MSYHPETDSLSIELRAGPGTQVREVAPGLNADLNARGEVVGFGIDRASRRLDLTTVETVAPPPATPRAA